jgi:hypothetical protein
MACDMSLYALTTCLSSKRHVASDTVNRLEGPDVLFFLAWFLSRLSRIGTNRLLKPHERQTSASK